MSQEETEDKLSEERNPEGHAEKKREDAFRKASEIEQIDDSHLPQSIKELFNS
jgi:hypothetical protein